jgi:hypothetical protein
MTESTLPQPTENVGRGLLFSLGAFAIAIVGFIILSGVIGIYGWITGIVAIAIPYASAWLYEKGAYTAPKAGRLQWVLLTAGAVIVGAVTSLLAATFAAFTAVGGDGGFFAPAFWRTVGNAMGRFDFVVPVLITLVVGAAGIVSVLRGPRKRPGQSAPGLQPVDAATPATPLTDVPPPPAAPSQGVVLNGEPLDPDKR